MWLCWGGRRVAPWGIPRAFYVACINGSGGPKALGGIRPSGTNSRRQETRSLGFHKGTQTRQASKLCHSFFPPTNTH